MGDPGESSGATTAVKKERPGLLVLRDQVGPPARAKGDGAARRDWDAPCLSSAALAPSVEDSTEAFPVADVLWLFDEAFVPDAFAVDVDVAAPVAGVVGEKGLRSAFRKAATPAFVLS